MTAADVIGSAFESLAANKVRSGLTMLGVVIGVALVIILVSLGESARLFVDDQMRGIGFGRNGLIIHPGRMDPPIEPSKLRLEDSREISRRIPEVLDQVPIVVGSAYIRSGGQEHKTSIRGFTENYTELVNHRVESGTFLTALDVEQHRKTCVIGQKIKDKMFGGMAPIGETVRLAGRRFTVVGVMEKKGEMMGDDLDDMVIVPITSAQDLLDTDKLNAIIVWSRSTEDLSIVREKIGEFLSGRHMRKDDFHFHTQEEMISILGTITGTLTAFVSGVAAVSLLVGCIGIVNIMLVSVLERTREIGIRKAVGARHQDIFWQFFGESMVLGMLGGFTGLFTGVGAAALVMKQTGLPVQISGWAVGLALACSLGVGVVAGVYPAMRAARANPIQALRFEH
ncbi:ABC transporter permease [bacterium]|nr:ABC transporter permease [bacterium]